MVKNWILQSIGKCNNNNKHNLWSTLLTTQSAEQEYNNKFSLPKILQATKLYEQEHEKLAQPQGTLE